jgi:hypothetical protein
VFLWARSNRFSLHDFGVALLADIHPKVQFAVAELEIDASS